MILLYLPWTLNIKHNELIKFQGYHFVVGLNILGAVVVNKCQANKGFSGEILGTHFINPLTTIVVHHIETRQLICMANQLTGFYMMENIGR